MSNKKIDIKISIPENVNAKMIKTTGSITLVLNNLIKEDYIKYEEIQKKIEEALKPKKSK